MAADSDGGICFETGQQDDGELLLPAGKMETPADVRRLHLKMIDVQRDRVNRALKAEKLQGPGLDRSTSTEMRRLNSMITAHHQFFEPEQEKPEKSAGILEGMLARVFEPNRKAEILPQVH